MQLPRFMLTPGKAPEIVERHPKIVALAQAKAYADHIAGSARKLAGKERARFLEESLKGLDPQQHELVLRALRRRGIKP